MGALSAHCSCSWNEDPMRRWGCPQLHWPAVSLKDPNPQFDAQKQPRQAAFGTIKSFFIVSQSEPLSHWSPCICICVTGHSPSSGSTLTNESLEACAKIPSLFRPDFYWSTFVQLATAADSCASVCNADSAKYGWWSLLCFETEDNVPGSKVYDIFVGIWYTITTSLKNKNWIEKQM